jgi:L-glutamine-phosphate cytidylyltransferase
MENKHNQEVELKAVVLAAGLGSRISEITKDIPKTMIEINGKCIFELILENLVENKIFNVVFIIGYREELLRPLLERSCSKLGVNLEIIVNERYATTNTMYSLWMARDVVKSNFLYLHGDLIFSPEMLRKFINSSEGNSVLVDKKYPSDWEDAMKIISSNSSLKYMSKSITLNEMDGVAIGMYKFNQVGRDELYKVMKVLVDTGATQNWISEAINILSKKININLEISFLHDWADVDNLVDLESANKLFKG